MTVLCLVSSLCLLCPLPSLDAEPAQEKPSVPAGAQVPPYAPGKFPYRLKWGADTVVAEVAHGKDSDDGDQQVRIVDASGHLLRRIGADRVEDVRLVTPLVAGEQGLLVSIAGGNSGLEDYYGFGTGASNRFHVSDAIQVDVKDLDGDGTAEVIAVYRLSDIDGGGEHHGAQVTVVYQWNGAKYVEATRSFPALTRAREKEDRAALAAIEAKTSQDNAAPGASEPDIDGHLNAANGYMTNAMLAGDGVEARAWLKDNVSADRLHVSSDMNKVLQEAIQSMFSPLAQDSGDDSEASPRTPRTAQNPQGARASLLPGQTPGLAEMGEARADVIAAFKRRPSENYDLKHGLVEDEWSGNSADGSGAGYRVSVWYRGGKVVQAEIKLTERQRGNVPSLSALVAHNRGLKEVCYGMSSYDDSGQPDGGANFYCFDDVKRGIAFGIWVNGDAYMTNNPDTLIIHVAGVPYIPLRGLTNVTRVTGAGAVLYQNRAEEDRAYAVEKRSSRAGTDKKR